MRPEFTHHCFTRKTGRKNVKSGPFQFKSFLIQPCVIMLIFNWLEGPPETLAGQQWVLILMPTHDSDALPFRQCASRELELIED